MEQILSAVINFFVHILGVLGPLFGIFLIIIESIFPVLPLAVFITLNLMAFGNELGFTISYFATIVGCIISYYAFKKGFSDKLYRHVKVKGKVHVFLGRINKLSLPSLSVLIALPFTPAFVVNITAGLSKMNTKKFILALLIGKPFIIYFWGFVGTSLVNSLMDIEVLIKITIILFITYGVSKFLQIKLKIEE